MAIRGVDKGRFDAAVKMMRKEYVDHFQALRGSLGVARIAIGANPLPTNPTAIPNYTSSIVGSLIGLGGF